MKQFLHILKAADSLGIVVIYPIQQSAVLEMKNTEWKFSEFPAARASKLHSV
jgi:hypothetical protein